MLTDQSTLEEDAVKIRLHYVLLTTLMIALLGVSPVASSDPCYNCGFDGRCTTSSSGYSYCDGSPAGCIAWGICPD